jgi:phthiocerol/phenolphthiocerol synthesis type-I polyketide synthase C
MSQLKKVPIDAETTFQSSNNSISETNLQGAVAAPLLNQADSKFVAIIGVAFRFPGDLKNEDDFWGALKLKRNLVTQIPADRWAVDELQHEKRSEPGRSITYSAGVLSRVDEFDADFFGISPREAAWLDPQQRLLLELSWEAMENAGIPPSSMAGSDCAVYVGISSLDYGTRGLDDLASMSSHSMTGNTLSIAANRLSYVFDFHGPSIAVDTACSSSLVALHHACNSLRAGDVSTALVGGVNLLLHPYPFVGFTKASMLSADGRCKPFDASADGYVRSEGGAVLLLKPLEKAIADGDEIQAVILASGVNSDGARKTGITIPSSEGQAELMREVLARSGLSADDVDFIEAHGTGTAVGDPIETAAIGRVYGQARTKPLPIGSVKSNLGHLEAASGMAGLVKALLAPMLHLQTPNPRIDFHALNLAPVTEYTALEKPQGKPLAAGINSFGFGGANAHVMLQEYVPQTIETFPAQEKLPPPIFLSARSDTALRSLAQNYADLLDGQSAQDFYDIAYAAAFRRDCLERRLALQADSVATAADLLRRFAQGGALKQVFLEDSLPKTGDVAFVYSGNGAQWVGMGRLLLADSPRFATIVHELDTAMRPQAGFSLIDELQTADAARLDDTTVAQPLLFAIQVAVTILLREQGVRPRAVTGHSVGEIAAAWAAGALNLEQAIHVICARSQSQGLTRGKGRMAAVGLSLSAAKEVIAEWGGGRLELEIAGINSPGNVTLSGSLEMLTLIQELLERRGVFFRLLDLDYAFHSREMDPIKENLSERLAGLAPSQSEYATFVSTVTGDVLDGTSLNAEYWWRNVREPVRFSDAVEKLAEIGCRVFVEIGPHAILQRYIGECLTVADIKGRVISTLRRNDDGLQKIVETALRVHLLAEHPDLKSYFPCTGGHVRLPNYPWQRERHWHPRTSEGLLSTERRRVHPLLGWQLPDTDVTWENTLDPIILPWLADHKVGGVVVYPGAAYAEMALAAAREWLGGEHFIVEQMDIVSPMVFDSEHGRTLRFVLNPRDGGFQIKSRQRLSNDEWTLHAGGRVLESAGCIPTARIDRPAAPTRQFERASHYRLASMLGLDYGPAFQGLRELTLCVDRLEASLEIPESLHLEDYLLHPALLDVCFQSLVDFFGDEIEAGQGIALLPVKIGRLELCGNGNIARLRARLGRRSARSVLADFELLDGENQLVARMTGSRFRAVHLKRHAEQTISRWSITPWLRPHPLDGLNTALPPISELALQARAQLANIKSERHTWFKETLPLSEALTLSLGYEAFQQLAQKHPQDWLQTLTTPHAAWLLDLLTQEGLMVQKGDQWTLLPNADLPSSKTLWQTLLRDAPAYMPQLAWMGRVGQHLPALLSGHEDAHALVAELRHSPIAEVLYTADPAYLGSHLAIKSTMRHLVEGRSASRRLRVLEIAAGPSDLPETLIDLLPEDHFDYVLALPDELMQARQQPEYRDHANIVVATFDSSECKLLTDRPLPDVFDVVILRHTLHRMPKLHAALAQTRRWLAAGGMVLLAERHPDWSANFMEGIDPAWWHESADACGAPVSSLLSPQMWLQTLNDAGFVDCETVIEPAAEGLAEGAYLLLAKRPSSDRLVQPEPAAASWLLLTDVSSAPLAGRLCIRLESRGQSVAVTDRISTDQLQGYEQVVHLLGWDDTPDQAKDTVARLLENVQQLASITAKVPRLWLVTRGGALATGLATGLTPNPAQSALWGFGRVVMNECPQLACTLIDLLCDPADHNTPLRLENELLAPDGANEIVLSPETRHALVMREETQRHTQQAQADSRYRLDFHVPGKLRNLVWLPQTERPLRDDEIEVSTRAAGLNFRDVMYLLGMLPDEAVESGFAGASLGLEFSGVVTRVGARVKDLLPGEAVMGFGASCFASHVVTRADAVAAKPDSWTFEAAATVPTVFFTVYYALRHLADLQPGDRVLIHGAAGGVGIAAIQLAQHLGAEIYATAGSDEKRDFVRLLGADHVFDSRSLAFADEILAATAGEGIDVVLNSLAGEAMRRSLDLLKPFGRFLELGKRDFFENTPLGLRPFKNNISYFGIDADQLLTSRPHLAARLFREVMALFREQAWAPLPYRAFSVGHIVDAYRVMQQARHIGKIVVSLADARPDIEQPIQPPVPIRFEKESTWLVTGGLCGFGLESARWLAERGVGHLVLVGRRGMATPGVQDIVESFAAKGVKVLVQGCDITNASAVDTLLERVANTMPPLKGILHAAASFDDQLIANLDAQSIESVLGAKLLGAWHLHQATLSIPLQHFVLYSSVTTTIGNPGQANYVAANAGLEGLAAMRRTMGLPATCIAWGPIGDAGYLVRNQAVKNSLEQRLGRPPIMAAEALAQLDRAFAGKAGLVTIANFDWNALARLLPCACVSRFDILNRNRQNLAQAADSLNIRALIAGKTSDEIVDIVRDMVTQEVAQILCIASGRIEPNRSLHDLGMDSLMAVELALGLEQRFGIQMPVMMLNDSPTANNVTARIVEKLIGGENVAHEALFSDQVTEIVRQHGGGLTQEEMQALHTDARMLAQTGTKLIA